MTDGSAVRPESSRISRAVPAGACDCHMHVFGALDRYPPSATRTYTPKEAPLSAYRAVASSLGLSRMVVVQPTTVAERAMATTHFWMRERRRKIVLFRRSVAEAGRVYNKLPPTSIWLMIER